LCLFIEMSLGDFVKRIIYRLLYKLNLFVDSCILELFLARRRRVDGIGLNFNFFLNLFLLFNFEYLEFSSRKVLFEKLSLCEGGKSLA